MNSASAFNGPDESVFTVHAEISGDVPVLVCLSCFCGVLSH